MKGVSLLIVSVIVMVGQAEAAPHNAYIGLYADANRQACSVSFSSAFYPIELWIWCLPGYSGVRCTEFAIQYPASILATTVTPNPLISVAIGTLSDGMSCCYADCQDSWVWTHHQLCYPLNTAADFIRVIPHPESGGPQIANCMCALSAEPPDPLCPTCGYPIEPLNILNHLALNQPCFLGVRETSWGAIKELYR